MVPLALIDIRPDPVIVQLGPLTLGWYGVLYVVALAVMLTVSLRELERRGIARQHLWNAVLLVAICAIVGARLYHVIDRWEFYSANPLFAVLPIGPDGRIGFTGLALFGGIAGAAVGIVLYGLWSREGSHRIRLGLDAVIPGTLFAQGIARWGNFFNQELYGPPTDAPWGIAIDCARRLGTPWLCPEQGGAFPLETTGFHPLFFYESALNITGGLVALYLSRRHLPRLRAGDLAAFWGIWYGGTRLFLETFREGWNWTVAGIPTAQLLSLAVIAVGIAWIAWNHRPGRPPEPVPVDVGATPSGDVLDADRQPENRTDASS
jgi:phosphatidylglycerol---prolipoprotein diacylglyceryl transferase